LYPVSARKLIAKLNRAGFEKIHQRGSHLYLKNFRGKIVTVPVHGSKDIPTGTLRNIVIRQVGLSADEFNKL